ncbi:KEOPS complex subunit Bud32 [Carex littledalei]|uniref:non-specific serine/threonine protein kinase n=1 Tax=Carex littledalei TaxID=544730 RepID=A0A833QNI5_9POAL|nr:KEOPS complex subunit Bud32 [Carex littledalei]
MQCLLETQEKCQISQELDYFPMNKSELPQLKYMELDLKKPHILPNIARSPFASRAGRQRSEVKETAAEWRSRDTKFLTLAGSRWCHLNGRYRRRVTFGVVVRSLVPNRRMSNSFPCGSWPDHSGGRRFRRPRDSSWWFHDTIQEARCMTKARRLGVVTTVLYGVDSVHHTLTFEFIEGSSVKDILLEFGSNGIIEERLNDIAAHIGTGIVKLHDRGLVHGDLTTSNMIVKEGTNQVMEKILAAYRWASKQW